MYHKHNTEGIVISGSERGETSRSIVLFTRDFGLIHVSVQAGRAMASKLRYGVQDFTLGDFTLIKARLSWKLVGGEAKKSLFPEDKIKRILVANIFNLLTKIVGEEKNEKLYEIVKEATTFLLEANQEDMREIESLTVLRILENQGFVRGRASFDECLKSPFITKDEIDLVRDRRVEVVNMINESLGVARADS